ncbi:hypothetical protein TIFTF001_021786 [Ficus carica]|uniref:Uncharacterized protein n=1 Tax=Ficus carica TaxID=3494 RepID=A0AA88AZ27_FICCA|nr:hypothetical protein TIFTF001_021786 [Ficus carica]
MCPTIQVIGGHKCRSLVLVHAASTMSVRSGGGWWRWSKKKDMYRNRYRMLGVRWCRAVDVACPATVQLSAGSQRRGNSGISRSTDVLAVQPGDLRRDSICSHDPTSMLKPLCQEKDGGPLDQRKRNLAAGVLQFCCRKCYSNATAKLQHEELA